MQDILILGAGYAGLMSALRLQKLIKAQQARVTLINAVETFTQRIRLHQVAAGQKIKQYPLQDFLRGTGIHFVHATVQSLDPHAQTVTIQSTNGQETRHYDTLIYALGSQVDREALVGVRERAYTLDKNSAHALAQALLQVAELGGRFIVIGGGLTGIEAVAEFAERHPNLDVHLVSQGEIAAGLSDKGRAYVRQSLEALGVTLHDHCPVKSVEAGYLQVADAQLPYDLVLWAGGFKALPLANEAGLPTNRKGQIRVEETLQVQGFPNIYAVGDAAYLPNFDKPLRMACAVALPLGAHAASNIISASQGQEQAPFRFAYLQQCVSLGRHKGISQMVKPNDSPKETIYTGRFGAFIKEAICQYTILTLKQEKLFPMSYRFPQAQARPQALELSSSSMD